MDMNSQHLLACYPWRTFYTCALVLAYATSGCLFRQFDARAFVDARVARIPYWSVRAVSSVTIWEEAAPAKLPAILIYTLISL